MGEFLRQLQTWWNGLTPGAQDQIIGGLVVAAVVGALGGAGALVRRLWRRRKPVTPPVEPQKPPNLPPIRVEVQPVQIGPLVSTERHVPKPPHRRAIRFIPRHDEQGRDLLDQLKQTLLSGSLVTLWGPGGAGKTRLALETAHALFAELPGGVIWTSADARVDYTCDTLLGEIVTQFGREDARPLARESKAAVARTLLAEQSCLLVLDNFETIAADEQAALLPFLDSVSCAVLVTSRDRLPHGQNFKLGPMSESEAQAYLRALVEASPVRARLEKLDLTPVLNAAERNPMLIGWLVAQVAESAQRPADVLAELARGEGDAATRIFGRSWSLLDPDAQTALLALTLCVPDATHEALAAVCGRPDDLPRANRALRRLANLFLVESDPATGRVSLEALTRRLAAAQLNRDPRAADLRQRFVAHCLDYAQAHAKPTPEDLDALDAERDNLLAAMDVAYAGQEWQSVMGLMDALGLSSRYLELRGQWEEGLRRYQAAAKAAGEVNDDRARAHFVDSAAMMFHQRGQPEKARRLFEESLAIERKVGDQQSIVVSLHNLGAWVRLAGHPEEARRLCEESLAIKRKLDDQQGIAATLHLLGQLAQDAGQPDEARRLFEESLAIDRRLGDRQGLADSLYQLGILAQDTEMLNEARHLYEEDLAIKRKLGNQHSISNTLRRLVKLAQGAGKADEAHRLYEELLEISRRLGNQLGIADTLYQLGLLAEDTGQLKEAARLFQESLDIFDRLGSPKAKISRESLERVEKKMAEGG